MPQMQGQPVSGRIVAEVLDHAPEDLNHGDLLVLIALAEGAHDRTRIARQGASSAVLAHKARTSPGSVRNALSRLRDRGLIVPLHDKPRRGLSQEYRIIELGPEHRSATMRPRNNGVTHPMGERVSRP